MNRFVHDLLDGDPLLTPVEVAGLFRCQPKTVIGWARRGWIDCTRTPSGKPLFRESTVRALLDDAPKVAGRPI